MGTRTLNDIHNDIKQLITAITSFEVLKTFEELISLSMYFENCKRFVFITLRLHVII